MLPRSRPRFGSGFEQLEAREVPATHTFTVNTTADTPFVRVLNGNPVDANDNISLRAVVDYANLNPETGDPVNNYLVELTSGTITLDPNLGTFELESNMSFTGVRGPGGTLATTIQRSGTNVRFGLFEVTDGLSVSFYSVKLQGGEWRAGGAILVDPDASLRVEGCLLQNNTATNGGLELGRGGAIFADSGSTVYINNSTLSGNTAQTEGGAIATRKASSLTIYGSTISGNSVTGTGQGEGYGGGLAIFDTFSTRIDGNTSITGNGATLLGGGVYLDNNEMSAADPVFEMDGGSISNNLSGASGGGLYVYVKSDMVVTLSDVSLTGNTSSGGKGGGAYILRGTLTGSLTALIGNATSGGIPGIAYKANQAAAPITVPANQQTVQQDP